MKKYLLEGSYKLQGGKFLRNQTRSHMLSIAGQTAGLNGLTIFFLQFSRATPGPSAGTILKTFLILARLNDSEVNKSKFISDCL